MRRFLVCLVVLSASLSLVACATSKRKDSLTDTLNAYAAALRWGDFQQASMFIDPAYRKAQPMTDLDMERYKQVRVSEYDDGNGPVPVDPQDVQQVVQIGLINVHTQQERTLLDHQSWHYDEKTQHWWLTSGLPDLTQQ